MGAFPLGDRDAEAIVCSGVWYLRVFIPPPPLQAYSLNLCVHVLCSSAHRSSFCEYFMCMHVYESNDSLLPMQIDECTQSAMCDPRFTVQAASTVAIQSIQPNGTQVHVNFAPAH